MGGRGQAPLKAKSPGSVLPCLGAHPLQGGYREGRSRPARLGGSRSMGEGEAPSPGLAVSAVYTGERRDPGWAHFVRTHLHLSTSPLFRSVIRLGPRFKGSSPSRSALPVHPSPAFKVEMSLKGAVISMAP